MSSDVITLVQRIISTGTNILGTALVGAQLLNSSSLSTQLASTREFIRKIEKFVQKVQPHEREKIERGQPGYFEGLTKKLRRMSHHLTKGEQRLVESDKIGQIAHQYTPAVLGLNELKQKVQRIVDDLKAVHADLLKTTNAIRARIPEIDGDSDPEDDTKATASSSAIMLYPVDQSNILPVLSSDRPSASSLVPAEQFEIPAVSRSAHKQGA
ncbi:predicted protein [Postia placenta Mad-698-R]|uniref:Uncharacterized protein n=1 Tax=Postia placenta MAD-698-R-SB12 TaxID=670580 RepID=A0A1X6MWG4_9APHY|nr:hypothetical protein POSPLADRAFT_1075156 [Postia placenta MAD-698-R-SB12]EED81126.1 predicted protein [Postia placenta Mad-698-R]OSX60566.1 hypothetical protein POSPLADRAFT_1075156 [Postia placenta MAD-698-R-SB12]